MPSVITPTNVLFFVAVLFLVGLISAAVLGSLQALLRPPRRRSRLVGTNKVFRHCRYCRWGHAVLHQESVKVEDRDRITVRCYVCNSCSLPQWVVDRVPVNQPAES